MTLLLLFGRGAAFISEILWPAVALGFLAVVIAPAIWSRRRDRQRAAMAVIGVILQAVTTAVVTRRCSRPPWQDVFADLLTSEEQLPLPSIGSARIHEHIPNALATTTINRFPHHPRWVSSVENVDPATATSPPARIH